MAIVLTTFPKIILAYTHEKFGKPSEHTSQLLICCTNVKAFVFFWIPLHFIQKILHKMHSKKSKWNETRHWFNIAYRQFHRISRSSGEKFNHCCEDGGFTTFFVVVITRVANMLCIVDSSAGRARFPVPASPPGRHAWKSFSISWSPFGW